MVTSGTQADRRPDEVEFARLHAELVRRLDRRSSARLKSARAAEGAVQQAWLKLLERRNAGAQPLAGNDMAGNDVAVGDVAAGEVAAGEVALGEMAAGELAACRQWLASVAHWELLRDDALRGERCVELDDEVGEAAPVPSRMEQLEQAHAVLRALSRDDRIVLLLRTWFDVPFDTIALALDCSSIHAARCALSRAMARARRLHERSAAASPVAVGGGGAMGAAGRASRRDQPRSKRASSASSGSNTRSQS